MIIIIFIIINIVIYYNYLQYDSVPRYKFPNNGCQARWPILVKNLIGHIDYRTSKLDIVPAIFKENLLKAIFVVLLGIINNLQEIALSVKY